MNKYSYLEDDGKYHMFLARKTLFPNKTDKEVIKFLNDLNI